MSVDASSFTEKPPNPTWMNVDAGKFARTAESFKEAPQAADKWGLDIAYKQPSGIFVQDDTMYIAGTKLPSLNDMADDFLIPFGMTAHGHRYASAKAALTPKIKRVVGHSLGGSVALELAKEKQLQSETYGAPVFSTSESSTRHRYNWDPISMFDRGATSAPSPGWNPHNY